VPIRASLEIFAEAGIQRCREKSEALTGFLLECLQAARIQELQVITPANPQNRGCQISLRMIHPDKLVFDAISKRNIIADWREPDVIRVAPVPLYNTFEDVFRFVEILKEEISG